MYWFDSINIYEKENSMIYIQLFLSFLQIGLFSFGGGYAAMPLIQNQVVDTYHWLSMTEFTDLITISQMTPGPIAINSATFVGMKVADVPGAVVATLGCILPSCILVTILAYVYIKYKHLKTIQNILETLRPAVVSLIAVAGLSIIISAFFQENNISFDTLKFQMIAIFCVCLYLLLKKKMNPIFIMILAGLLNMFYEMIYILL